MHAPAGTSRGRPNGTREPAAQKSEVDTRIMTVPGHRQQFTSSAYRGLTDEVRLWTTARTAEVQGLMFSATTSTAGLNAAWRPIAVRPGVPPSLLAP